MKNIPLISILLVALFSLNTNLMLAQRVRPLVPGIQVESVLAIHAGATKIAMDKVSGNLFYSTLNGNIYEVSVPSIGTATDVLTYTSANHGISNLQGFFMRDSVIFVCGNNTAVTTTVGKIVKGTLQPNGTRIWVDVVTTSPYPCSSPYGDHGFTGVKVEPSGNYIYVSSGARTHLGEIRTNRNAWPGLREVPMTCHIFRFPISTVGLVLPNDSLQLANSGYIYVSGTRNAYSMNWNGNGDLFSTDNSGERDDPEELNWIRPGRHYGYPWRMGGNDNPLRFSPYDATQDPLVNRLSGGYLQGWFANDPTFPRAPAGVTFTEPVRNYGTAADYYRDNVTGAVRKASTTGTYISTFTSHRSPLGLVFDADSALAAPFSGDGFVLSYMPGGDSTGYSPQSPWGSPCPFVDTCRDLVQMKLIHDPSIDNFTMTTSRIAEGFYLPVDAVLSRNMLYVLENNHEIWRITFPSLSGIQETETPPAVSIYPNPFNNSTTIEFKNPQKEHCTLTLYSSNGQIVRTISDVYDNKIALEKNNLASGIYYFHLNIGHNKRTTGKIMVH